MQKQNKRKKRKEKMSVSSAKKEKEIPFNFIPGDMESLCTHSQVGFYVSAHILSLLSIQWFIE